MSNCAAVSCSRVFVLDSIDYHGIYHFILQVSRDISVAEILGLFPGGHVGAVFFPVGVFDGQVAVVDSFAENLRQNLAALRFHECLKHRFGQEPLVPDAMS